MANTSDQTRYLAVDYGFKRIGLALADPAGTFASPLAVIENNDRSLAKIADFIAEYNVGKIVVGLPFNMDGSKGDQAMASEKFAAVLAKKTNLPTYLHDERLSSYAAQEKLDELPAPKKKKKKALDALAAAHILQSYLDAQK